MNWQNLKLGKRKSMKMLAPYFAKACVDIVNAKTVIKVPDRIAIMKKMPWASQCVSLIQCADMQNSKKKKKMKCVD